MQSQHFATPKRYLEVITRNKWLLLGCSLLFLTCALMLFLKQEKLYKSEALLGFQQQDSNTIPLVSRNPVGIDEEVTRITQRVLSQSNLEALIDEEHLRTEHRQELSPVELVEETRKKIKIIPYLSEYNIRMEYTGRDPEKVARVANRLADSFIEEDLRYLNDQTMEMSVIVQDELARVKDALNNKEAELQDYKLRYFYEMPDKQGKNKSRLTALRDKYKSNEDSISLLKKNREEMLAQISVQKQVLEDQQRPKNSSSAEGQQSGTSINIDQQAKLDMLNNSLMELKNMYTEQHPMVIRVNKQITEIERLIDEGQHELNSSASIEIQRDNGDNILLSLRNQIQGINLSITKLENENFKNQALINKFEELLASSAIRAQEWSVLTEEYDALKEQRDLLVAQDLQAVSALTTNGANKMSRFMIENPAPVPTSPIKPRYFVIAVLSAVAGLVIGGIISFVRDALDATFKSQIELEQSFDLPIICSVPHLPLSQEILRNRIRSVVRSGIFLVWFSVLCAALIVIR